MTPIVDAMEIAKKYRHQNTYYYTASTIERNKRREEISSVKGYNDIKILFNIEIRNAALVGFLKKTRLATRTWILGNIEEEIEYSR